MRAMRLPAKLELSTKRHLKECSVPFNLPSTRVACEKNFEKTGYSCRLMKPAKITPHFTPNGPRLGERPITSLCVCPSSLRSREPIHTHAAFGAWG